MNIPQRWQRSRKAGAKQPESCRYVGRGTPWGSMYPIEKNFGEYVVFGGYGVGYVRFGDDKKAAAAYSVKLYKDALLDFVSENPTYFDELLSYEYISCFCPLDMPCHCDAIIEHLTKRAAELGKILQNAV